MALVATVQQQRPAGPTGPPQPGDLPLVDWLDRRYLFVKRHAWLLVAALFLVANLVYLTLPAPLVFAPEFDVLNGRTPEQVQSGGGEPRARTGDDLRLTVRVCNRLPWPVPFGYTRTLRSEPNVAGTISFVPKPPGNFVAQPGCHDTEVTVIGLLNRVPAGRWRLTGVAHVQGVLGREYHVPWQTRVVIVAAATNGQNGSAVRAVE